MKLDDAMERRDNPDLSYDELTKVIRAISDHWEDRGPKLLTIIIAARELINRGGYIAAADLLNGEAIRNAEEVDGI